MIGADWHINARPKPLGVETPIDSLLMTYEGVMRWSKVYMKKYSFTLQYWTDLAELWVISGINAKVTFISR